MPPGQIDVLIERVDNLINRIEEWEKRQNESEKAISAHDVEIARLKERQSLLAGAQATFSLIVSAIAAFLGGAFK